MMGGGVCSVLDYEVAMMAEYVSEMATRIVMPRSTVNAAFRKFVTQILSSTRLPSTTILLGMNYLAKRVNMMSSSGPTNYTEGQVWRMLTISLVLGSKFLDDNTFQNRSWSEVSGISVKELNSLEWDWLGNMEWCLYVNLDESKDYQAWLSNWEDWLESKKRAAARRAHEQATRERLASLVPPLNTEIPRARVTNVYSTWHQQQIAEYERLSSMKRNQPVLAPTPISCNGEQPVWGHCYAPPWQPPLTPPDSGYGGFGTPAASDSATSANARYADWFERALGSGVQRHFQPSMNGGGNNNTNNDYNNNNNQASQAHSAYPRVGSVHYNNCRSVWDSMAECNCAGSGFHAKRSHPYLVDGHQYSQPVVG